VVSPGTCEQRPLKGVYKPERLHVIQTCAEVDGWVAAYRLEHDGDYHVSMVMRQPGWTNAANDLRQHGYTVVEFTPGYKHPNFKVGMHLTLKGTKIYDEQHRPKGADHGWIELHPVFEYSVHETPADPPPNIPSLAPATED
jgi:hypothetical protein